MAGVRDRFEADIFLGRDDEIGNAFLEAALAMPEEVEMRIRKSGLGLPHEYTEFGGHPLFPKLSGYPQAQVYRGISGKWPTLPRLTNPKAKLLQRRSDFAFGGTRVLNHAKRYRFDDTTCITDMNIGSEYLDDWDGWAVMVESKSFSDKVSNCMANNQFNNFDHSRGLTPIFDFGDFAHNWQRTSPGLIGRGWLDGDTDVHSMAELFSKEKTRESCIGAIEVIESLVLNAEKISIHCSYLTSLAVLAALVEALEKGAKVDILTSKNPNVQKDSVFARLRALTHIAKENEFGDRLSIYLKDGMVHAKALQVDDSFLFIDSANLDSLSLFYATEVGVVIGPDYPAVQNFFSTNFKIATDELEPATLEVLKSSSGLAGVGTKDAWYSMTKDKHHRHPTSSWGVREREDVIAEQGFS